jgi:hypothetical protein
MHMSGNFRNRYTHGTTLAAVDGFVFEKLSVTMRAQALHSTQMVHGDCGAAVRRQIMMNFQCRVNSNTVAMKVGAVA